MIFLRLHHNSNVNLFSCCSTCSLRKNSITEMSLCLFHNSRDYNSVFIIRKHTFSYFIFAISYTRNSWYFPLHKNAYSWLHGRSRFNVEITYLMFCAKRDLVPFHALSLFARTFPMGILCCSWSQYSVKYDPFIT